MYTIETINYSLNAYCSNPHWRAALHHLRYRSRLDRLNPQTILFHHGIGANSHIWADWLPVLAAHYRLVRFDMRGFGLSVVPAKNFKWSFDVLIDDLLAVAEATDATRFHLVGESIGGTAALACALKAPERIRSLCLSNAAARGGLVSNVKGWGEIVAHGGQAAWARQMMQWRFHPDALPPALHAWYTRVHETCSMDATIGFGRSSSRVRSDASLE